MMLKIGEFSKLSHLTIKALRFYEKEGLLSPASIDRRTGYRSYETSQLETAARIKSYRQLGLTIEEIKAVENGADQKMILAAKAEVLKTQKKDIETCLSIIQHILEDDNLKYQVTIKYLPSAIVYYSEVRVHSYPDMMQLIPELGEEFLQLNPNVRVMEPPYEFCEYLDEEHRETDILIRYSRTVEKFGNGNDRIHFRIIPAVKVLSIFYKGRYDEIGEAYSYIMKYAEENGYQVCGLSRECYIDGIWNKEDPFEWLTEIQLPID